MGTAMLVRSNAIRVTLVDSSMRTFTKGLEKR